MKKNLWAVWAAVLMTVALLLRFGAGLHYHAYAIGAVSAGIVFWHVRKNLPVLVGLLSGAGLFLRFALRGYAW